MRERDPEVSEGRLVRLLFLDKDEAFRGGVEGGVGTDPLTLAKAGEGEARGVASRGEGVGDVDLTSSSTSIGMRTLALPL
jgi:hypothetical protein